MSKQIAVRLPDELVEFVDELVNSGAASSRTALVTNALERERRRRIAERDAEILARAGTSRGLDGIAAHALNLPSAIP
ncbi:MAG TPA: ribbon-helix-helix domain-containing protein [Solirubrobacteraceae bacterium]|jgi:Arc/MetJ-type ribon-helix-helix transcriptional regulator|nr:ribbon-helix-helix domain-containing protein [Solirubrobacteraceae bacterium]